MLRTLLPVGLCAALYALCMAELRSQAPAAQPPTFHADTHLVQVTVIATDSRMNPVIDLQVGDFRVFEDGQEQPISLFSADMRPTAATAVEIQPAGVANVSNQVPASGGVTVLLFDRLNTAWGDQAQARRNIINYLSQAPPTEKIGFYVLESSTVSIVHDFTSDTGSLLRALSRVQARTSREIDIAEGKTPTIGSGGPGATAIDAQLDAALERMDTVIKGEALKNRSESTLSALEAIARHLAGIPGRKNLIWVSSAFPLSFDDGFGTRSMYREVSIATRAIADADVSIYPVDARGLMGSAAVVARKPISGTLQANMPALDSMQMLAERTGGVVYTNTNDLGRAISRAVADARLTYTLGYYPSNVKWDGHFRRLSVKVRRPGVNVRHRSGYLALPPPPETADSRQYALVRALASPLNAIALPLTVSLEPAPNGELTATVKLSASAIRLSQTAPDVWEGSVDVAIAQAPPGGQLARAADVTVPLRFTTAMRDQALREGLNLNRRVRPNPQAHALRVAVRDPATGAIGSVSIPAETVRGVLNRAK
jgi:VWFA-related protein